MTTRERKEARIEKRREWAAGRAAKADASFKRAHDLGQMLPLGQPILVGHHSERGHRAHIAKIEAAGFGGVAHSKMAAKHAATASGIEDQLARTIFDDDPDAIERLTERVATLTARLEARKEANAKYRAEHKAELKGLTVYGRSQAVPYPSYSISNLGADIRRNKERLAKLEREAVTGETPRYLYSVKRAAPCRDCGATIEAGKPAKWYRIAGELACYPACVEAAL